MDKIKSVLSPGSSKDDEVLYGSEETRRKESLTNNTTEQEPPKLYPVEGAAGKKESGGVLSQITNPDGNKYDEKRFESTATSDPDPNKLHTDPSSKKDHTVLSQITNPGGHKYDEQRFEPTAATVGTEHSQEKPGIGEKLYPGHGTEQNNTHYPGLGNAEAAGSVDPNSKLETDDGKKKDHSILRQIFNPSGKKRDDVAYGTTAHATSDELNASETARSDRSVGNLGGTGVAAAGASTMLADRSVATGNNQTSTTLTDRSVATGNNQTSTTLTDRSVVPEHNQSGIAGASGNSQSAFGSTLPERSEPVVAGVASTGTPKYNEPQSHVLDRSHPLRDGSGAAVGHTNPVGAPEASMGSHASQTESIGVPVGANTAPNDTTGRPDSHINPVGAPNTAGATLPVAAGGVASSATGATAFGSSSGQSQAQSGVAGLGTSIAGATSASRAVSGSERERPHHPDGAELDCDGIPERGYVHHVDGPHSTDIANQLDPRVTGTSTTGVNSSVAGTTGSSRPTPSAGLATGTSTSAVDSSLAGPAGSSRATPSADLATGTSTSAVDSNIAGPASSSRATPSAGLATGASTSAVDSNIAGPASSSQATSSAGYATGTTGQSSHAAPTADHSPSHGSEANEKKEKTGLLQKILHPRSHKEGTDSAHEHPSTTVNDHGRNVLHKDPPSH